MKALTLFIVLSFRVSADTVSLDLKIEEGSATEIAISANTGNGDRGDVTYSGNLLGDLVFDPVTLAVESFSFTGGRVNFSDNVLTFTSLVLFDPDGIKASLNTRFTQTTTGTSATFSTLNSPGSIVSGNELLNEEHEAIFDQGSFTIAVMVADTEPQSDVVDFEENPETGPIGGTYHIAMEETSHNLYGRTFKVTLSQTINSSDTLAYEDTNAVLTFTEVGSIPAVASFSHPTRYGAWLLKNGLGNSPPETLNPHGLAYGLLFALDLPAAAASVPLTIQKSDIGLTANLPFPENGLPVSVRIEQQSLLTPALTWETLQSYPPGTTGPISVELTDQPVNFLRVVAALPTSETP